MKNKKLEKVKKQNFLVEVESKLHKELLDNESNEEHKDYLSAYDASINNRPIVNHKDL